MIIKVVFFIKYLVISYIKFNIHFHFELTKYIDTIWLYIDIN